MIGYSPAVIDRMSPAQYSACVDGYNKGNDPEGKEDLPTLSYDEFKEFMAL